MKTCGALLGALWVGWGLGSEKESETPRDRLPVSGHPQTARGWATPVIQLLGLGPLEVTWRNGSSSSSATVLLLCPPC